ncbi:MAG: hypothetical protein IPP14_08450 [Planctomycetes bacterium]|nr:hypothetical protein [Planctomycetota bacterium]
MLSHAQDLREFSKDGLLVEAIQQGFRNSPLDAKHKALCEWAEKLTLTPTQCDRADVDTLRAQGWRDEEVVSAAQIIGFFNHLNRLADGLGIDLEPEMRA